MQLKTILKNHPRFKVDPELLEGDKEEIVRVGHYCKKCKRPFTEDSDKLCWGYSESGQFEDVKCSKGHPLESIWK